MVAIFPTRQYRVAGFSQPSRPPFFGSRVAEIESVYAQCSRPLGFPFPVFPCNHPEPVCG